jgi:hypothetical protein
MVFAVVTSTDRQLEASLDFGDRGAAIPPPDHFYASTDLADGVYLYQVAAKDPDGDKLTYSLLKAPQGMTINPSTG